MPTTATPCPSSTTSSPALNLNRTWVTPWSWMLKARGLAEISAAFTISNVPGPVCFSMNHPGCRVAR
jgi:hypothetical protein